MKVKFSIRDLLAGVFLVAVLISIMSLFNDWRDSYVERRFREFRNLEDLRSLADGKKLSEVQLLFDDLMPLHRDLAKVVLSEPELSSRDEVFTVTVNESFARFLHFREGELVNHKFTAKDMQDSMNSLQAPYPQWYILYGQWLVSAVFLAVVGMLRLCWTLARGREIEHAT